MPIPRFHLAFPVTDLAMTRNFYAGLLGCAVGREDTRWIDFDFFGHQISAHLVDAMPAPGPTNEVDGKAVPVRHFGAVLDWKDWHALAERLRQSDVAFLIEPHIRFAGQVGEQATLFIEDPCGNGLEFKSFKDPQRLFAR
ncbi:MAG: VOC family protein [Gammaproteobacteria bacterium]|nr:VOC family protein [Gammaproteobacteria bacterium]MBU2478686.1 VOC family protein [Gammaproteobacteria bacterium]